MGSLSSAPQRSESLGTRKKLHQSPTCPAKEPASSVLLGSSSKDCTHISRNAIPPPRDVNTGSIAHPTTLQSPTTRQATQSEPMDEGREFSSSSLSSDDEGDEDRLSGNEGSDDVFSPDMEDPYEPRMPSIPGLSFPFG
ncbi:hypothetical protein PoB_002173400 [Plakobranchus ocellatus]|uniref:Uncharacterized protein n=1 Tax=Plakobranchus ocellatus TaxID=259542 RepID=A0AAV3ZMY0_9GAST|nr:hypothetical protein PoB_002173400 [Plakobranchus ocellatus]